MEVGVIGATGAVGREMLQELEGSTIRDLVVRPFASARSTGTFVPFRDRQLEVQAFSPEKCKGIPILLMSAGGGFSKEHSRQLAAQGSIVIDNSSAWRMEPDVPLVVPEVNLEALESVSTAKGGIIANPNCSTIQMVVALKPLADRFGLVAVNVATYQSVSGSGQKGITELAEQVGAHLKFQEPQPKFYDLPIAFNVLPAIDRMVDGGHCYEEVKMILETRKIMSLPKLPVVAATVRVPTFNCHCEAVTVTLGKSVTRHEAWEALRSGSGLTLIDEDDHKSFPTPRSVVGHPGVFVTRVRLPHGYEVSDMLQFWVVADNLKKGAATNAVQIFERLVSRTH